MRKVFSVSINKTGSKSCSEYVKKLGLRTMHDRPNGKSIRDAINRGKRAIPFMSSYDAFFDLPEDINLDRLIERFPDARFIMTTRNTEQWITSRIVHVLHNRTVSKKSWRDIDTQAWRKQKEDHENRVRETFKRLGKLDQLLIVDVCSNPEKAAYEIAQFLGVERNGIEFPRLNTGERKLQQISEKFKGPKPHTFAGKRGPVIIEEPEPWADRWPARVLLARFRQARQCVVKCCVSVSSFFKSLRFQSPIVRKS